MQDGSSLTYDVRKTASYGPLSPPLQSAAVRADICAAVLRLCVVSVLRTIDDHNNFALCGVLFG